MLVLLERGKRESSDNGAGIGARARIRAQVVTAVSAIARSSAIDIDVSPGWHVSDICSAYRAPTATACTVSAVAARPTIAAYACLFDRRRAGSASAPVTAGLSKLALRACLTVPAIFHRQVRV